MRWEKEEGCKVSHIIIQDCLCIRTLLITPPLFFIPSQPLKASLKILQEMLPQSSPKFLTISPSNSPNLSLISLFLPHLGLGMAAQQTGRAPSCAWQLGQAPLDQEASARRAWGRGEGSSGRRRDQVAAVVVATCLQRWPQ